MEDNVKKLVDRLVEAVDQHTTNSPPRELMPMHYMMLAKAELILKDYHHGKIPEKEIEGVLSSAIKAFKDYDEMSGNFSSSLVVRFSISADSGEGTLSIASGERNEDTIKQMMYKMYAVMTAYVDSLSQEERNRYALAAMQQAEHTSTSLTSNITSEEPRQVEFLQAINKISKEYAREYARGIYENIYEYIPDPDNLDRSVLNSIIDICSKVLDSSNAKELEADTETLKSILKKSLSI